MFEEQRSGAWADADTPESPDKPIVIDSATFTRRPRSGTGRKLPTPPVQAMQAARNRNSFSPVDKAVVNEILSEVDSLIGAPSPPIAPPVVRASSVDTEMLLRDTEQVVQQMAWRVQQREQRAQAEPPRESLWRRDATPVKPSVHSTLKSATEDSDSDNASTFAVVNGHEPKGRPRLNQSVSLDTHSQRSAKPQSNRTVRLRQSQGRLSPHSMQMKRSSGCSDIELELQSDHSDVSIISDTGDSHSPGTSRKALKSKSPISLAKTNRAFALRRARAEGGESDSKDSGRRSSTQKSETPRPRAGSITKDKDASRSRPTSTRTDTKPRSRPGSAGRETPSSARSRPGSARDQDSGAMSRSQRSTHSTASNNLTRTDGGRHSLRANKVTTSVTTHKMSRTPDPTRDKRMTRSLSTSATQSKDSRSSSPQTDEYSAWKRRKGYDPRRAVAEAKAKLRQTRSNSRPDPPSARSSVSSIGDIESLPSDNPGFVSTSSHTDELTRMSQEVLREVSVLSRNIENDISLHGTSASLVSACFQHPGFGARQVRHRNRAISRSDKLMG